MEFIWSMCPRLHKPVSNIICEKPLEITPERIDKMIEICERNQVMLSGIFPRRFNDSTRIFKNALDARDSENWFFAILQLSGGGPRILR